MSTPGSPNRIRDIVVRRSTFLIGLTLILGAFALLRTVVTHKDVEDIANIDIPLIEILTQIETNQLEQAINFERALRYAEEFEIRNNAHADFENADSLFRYLAKLVDLDLLEVDNQITEALSQTDQESQKITLRGLLLSVKKLENDHTNYENHALEVIQLLEKNEIAEALLLSDRVEEEENQFNKQIEGVLMRHERFTESLAQIVEQEEVLSMKWIVTLTLLFVVLSLVAVYTFSFRLWRPLEDIREGAQKLGDGDLETRIHIKPTNIAADIVTSFNQMADQLQDSQAEIDRFIHFSYSTAHDLKAPILNMKSLLDMLEKSDIGSANHSSILRNAKKSADQLEKTVNALAEVNQVREELKSEKEHVLFEEVFKEVVGQLVSQIKDAGATIKKDFSDCPDIEYAHTHVKSIFLNLITNSLKYRDPDKPLVIRMKTVLRNGHTSLIYSDNGLGFDAIKHKDTVFKPFVRLHSHTEGTGLGMYIIKTILNYHKGNIRIDSQPKKGATFALRLN